MKSDKAHVNILISDNSRQEKRLEAQFVLTLESKFASPSSKGEAKEDKTYVDCGHHLLQV